MDYLLLFFLDTLFWCLLLGLIPAFIARSKGRNFTQWYIYGVLLFIVAFIHSLFLKDQSGTRCPACKEWIQEDATVCKHCQTVIADFINKYPGTKQS